MIQANLILLAENQRINSEECDDTFDMNIWLSINWQNMQNMLAMIILNATFFSDGNQDSINIARKLFFQMQNGYL